MAKRKRQRITESQTATVDNIYFEAAITPTSEADNLTGREWDVTIIGGLDKAVTVEGEEFIRSDNGRLYSVEAIVGSVAQWEGVKVYDNHQTEAEFNQSGGMRSVENEWLGSIVGVAWEAASKSLVGTLKVVKDSLAAMLKNAHDQGILETIGLSITAFPDSTREAMLENTRMKIIDGFHDILSVDLVGNPAAGGKFNRIIAAKNNSESPNEVTNIMDKNELAELLSQSIGAALEPVVSRLDNLEAAKVEESETSDESAEQETVETPETPQAESDQPEADVVPDAVTEALQALELGKTELILEQKLSASKLPEKFQAVVRQAVSGRVVEASAIDAMIKAQKDAQASEDTTGRVTENGRTNIEPIIDEQDKKAAMLMAKLMGREKFAGLETESDRLVSSRVSESAAYKSWLNSGKTSIEYGGRVSELLRTGFLNGQWGLDELPYTEALNLATVIKNTVNIMIAVDYAGSNRWYEGLVDIIESDNPIDDLTLARLFGADGLDVVAKGAPYTEMQLQDEEETAAHVKQGNYVAVNLEDLMADKIDYFRSMPTRLADAWYNTLSAKVAAVFTTNTAAGPVLSDTGALFNSTAVTTAGGHANLLTTALSWTAYDTVVTAMYNQTARTLGTGRKLVDMGGFTILVPNDLRATANKIRNSVLQPESDFAGTAGNQSSNQYGPDGDQPQVVIVPDWTDANDWAVLARYRGASPIKLAFPTGMMTPQVVVANNEAAGTLFTNDTIRYKLRMMTYRFSATYDTAPVADWRLLHKSNVS